MVFAFAALPAELKMLSACVCLQLWYHLGPAQFNWPDYVSRTVNSIRRQHCWANNSQEHSAKNTHPLYHTNLNTSSIVVKISASDHILMLFELNDFYLFSSSYFTVNSLL